MKIRNHLILRVYTDVIPLDSGPALILAGFKRGLVKERRGTMCPDSSIQVIRVTWTGGVRLPDGNELGRPNAPLSKEVEGENDQRLSMADYLADLEDRDNNHYLVLILSCLLSQFHSRRSLVDQTEISILIHLSLYYERITVILILEPT